MKFRIGTLYFTSGINNQIIDDINFSKEIMRCIAKYIACDWGNLCILYKKLNDNAVKNNNDRILAKYATSQGNIYIITEWDRSATTVLFTDEY